MMFPFVVPSPPRVGRTWSEIDRDDTHVIYRCRGCHKLSTSPLGWQPPGPCSCEAKK